MGRGEESWTGETGPDWPWGQYRKLHHCENGHTRASHYGREERHIVLITQW